MRGLVALIGGGLIGGGLIAVAMVATSFGAELAETNEGRTYGWHLKDHDARLQLGGGDGAAGEGASAGDSGGDSGGNSGEGDGCGPR